MTKAHYSYSYLYKHRRNFLLIVDLKTGWKSVTNDIENVIAEIIDTDKIEIENFNILYRDQIGVWDCWDHFDQTFKRVGREDLDQALQRYIEIYMSPRTVMYY